jgi:hypothetical protein
MSVEELERKYEAARKRRDHEDDLCVKLFSMLSVAKASHEETET